MIVELVIMGITLFGICAIYLSFELDRTRKNLQEHERKQKQKDYQTAVLAAIHDKISYSLDVEKIIGVITGSLRNLFPYSTASSLVLENDLLVFKTYVEETVNQTFIDTVKKNMTSSLELLLDTPLPQKYEESLSGVMLNDGNLAPVFSYFQIPLVVNDKVLGIINVSSTKSHKYTNEEMTTVYQIATQASNALSRLQDVLTNEKGKLMAMISSLLDGVFMVDINNEVTIINNAAKSILHITSENPSLTEIINALPQSVNLSSKIYSAISNNKVIEEKDIAIKDKIVQLSITPVTSFRTAGVYPKERVSGGVLGAAIALHDITLEKNLSQMKEDFTNMMVHELRAPLTAMRGSSQLMLTNTKLNGEDNAKLLTIIYEQSKKLLDQVGSILDAAKLEAGRFTIEKSVEDVRKVLEDKVQIFTPQAETKHVKIVSNIDDYLPKASFDSLRIGQVINNLLINSMKFTPEGGTITLSAHYDPHDDHHITISVSDTGVGISKDKMGELFSKFSQLSKSTGGSAGLSTGLGLYITKGIVEAHGGVITVVSEPNHGATFSFTLPVANQQPIAEAKPKEEIHQTDLHPVEIHHQLPILLHA